MPLSITTLSFPDYTFGRSNHRVVVHRAQNDELQQALLLAAGGTALFCSLYFYIIRLLKNLYGAVSGANYR